MLYQNSTNFIIIGDIHGRTYWKKITDKHPHDEIVFVGDYFDTKDAISSQIQIQNFEDLLALKRAEPQRVHLLFGNHDFHYLPEAGETYSGYQYFASTDIYEAIRPAIDEQLFEICLQRAHYLISHAGLTKTWCSVHGIPLDQPEKWVNTLFYQKPEAFRFSPGARYEPTGDESEQGPLWVRPASLLQDALEGFIQVVGHTQLPAISITETLIMVDVLGYSPEYLVISPENKPLIARL